MRIYTRALAWNDVQLLPQQATTQPYVYASSPDVNDGYNLWLLANSLPLSTAPNGIIAGDGIFNLMKSALDIPAYANGYQNRVSHGTVVDGGNTYLSLTYTRPEPAPSGISYAVESCTDLSSANWTTNGLVEMSSTVSAGMRTITVRGGSPINSNSQSFLHLKVSQY